MRSTGFKMLKGRMRRTYQFEIDRQYRVRFAWENGRAIGIEIGDSHDEEK
jgi:plasmid maintenance system killer protein